MSLAALRARIADKELEIALQRQTLAQLEASLDELTSELFRLSTYPTLSLPPEVLSEIFIHCLPAAGVDSSSTNEAQAPLLLTQVCETWKRVALGTPQLWTALNCNFDLESWAGQRLIDAAAFWLRPEGAETFKLGLFGHLMGHSHHEQLMDLVRINASRLSTLCLCFHPEDFDEWARRKPQLDQLRELAIEVERRDVTSFIHLGDTFADSKYLHRVVLDSVLPSQIYLPWTQITEFECRNYSPAKAVELLDMLPNLLRFTIILSDPDTEEPRLPELHHSTHPKLEYLRCSEGPDTGHTDIHMLAFLTLPNLTTLMPGRIDDEVLLQFLDRSGWPPLTKLDFYDDCWESYTEILVRLQHLKELHIDYPSRFIMGSITSGLKQDDPSFLPKLERFSLFQRGIDAIGEFLTSVAPAVRARNARADSDERFSRVRSVKITMLHGDPEWTRFQVPEKYLRVYRQLRDEGVEVHVGSPEYCFVNESFLP